MSEDNNVTPPKAEVLVPVGTLHLDCALAQEPALEFAAGDHIAPLTSSIPSAMSPVY